MCNGFLSNRNYLAVAGRFMERIFPGDLKFATTEMDTFGLNVDREVLDLWGYSNRKIATSSTCNGLRVRNNPSIFLEARSEVFFPFWFSDSQIKGPQYFYENAEEGMLFMHLSRNQGNMLGDMNQVAERYDLWLMTDKAADFKVAALIRKDKKDQMEKSLSESSFSFARSRRLNSEYFQKYNEQSLIQYPC